jgi:adenylylsulfate kinase
MDRQRISPNTRIHPTSVARGQREQLNRHRSIILWFTGLSGSGKSTLAHALEAHLHALQCRTFVLDGDHVRQGLCGDLGFTAQDRQENIRRVAEVAKLMLDAGLITLTAFISPFQAERHLARQRVADGDFVEIYCDCPLLICEQRDVKGLYRKARQGEIAEFTGISSPYEAPSQPDITVYTGRDSLEHCVQQVLADLRARGVIA